MREIMNELDDVSWDSGAQNNYLGNVLARFSTVANIETCMISTSASERESEQVECACERETKA